MKEKDERKMKVNKKNKGDEEPLIRYHTSRSTPPTAIRSTSNKFQPNNFFNFKTLQETGVWLSFPHRKQKEQEQEEHSTTKNIHQDSSNYNK